MAAYSPLLMLRAEAGDTFNVHILSRGIVGLRANRIAACNGNNPVSAHGMLMDDMKVISPSIKDVLDASNENIPTLTAVGYAVTSTQPGRNEAQKRLMAIRSARMAAMRDLAEQIHGLKVDSSTTVIDLVVQNDTFRGVVNGTIRGARTVRINPTGSDTYEVVLEIDRETIGYLLKTARVAA